MGEVVPVSWLKNALRRAIGAAGKAARLWLTVSASSPLGRLLLALRRDTGTRTTRGRSR